MNNSDQKCVQFGQKLWPIILNATTSGNNQQGLIHAIKTYRKPFLKHWNDAERSRVVAVLYDTQVQYEPGVPPVLFVQWFHLCQRDIIPYTPLRPPVDEPDHLYRLELYEAPDGCALNLPIMKDFLKKWESTPGHPDRYNRRAAWIQPFLNELRVNPAKFHLKRWCAPLEWRVTRAGEPRPSSQLLLGAGVSDKTDEKSRTGGWLIRGTCPPDRDKCTIQTIENLPPLEIVSGNPTFDIHDNGGTPFKVQVNTQERVAHVLEWRETPDLTVNGQVLDLDSEKKETPPPKTDDECGCGCPEGSYKPLMSFRYERFWSGRDWPSMRAGCSDEPFIDGNTILMKTVGNTYVWIGNNGILKFQLQPNDEVVTFMSPIGPNDVPYPYVLGRTHTYLLLEWKAFDNAQREPCVDPYDQLYGWGNDYGTSKKPATRKLKTFELKMREMRARDAAWLSTTTMSVTKGDPKTGGCVLSTGENVLVVDAWPTTKTEFHTQRKEAQRNLKRLLLSKPKTKKKKQIK